ncbi:MAG: MCE family protein [Verrucomicrobia bacterium]|nr:MCE family protein [Verrucomicrobiota bacterium]
MSQSRLEWKVGLFVLIALILMAAVVLKFSKGTSVFDATYEITLRTKNVGGLIEGAVVLMAGVPVGHVADIDLGPGGTNAVVRLQILKSYPIHRDADFSIKQAGFLGDRFVSVVPTANAPGLLQNGDVVESEEPFDLQEMARSAVGLLQRVDDTAKRLNDAVKRIDRTLFAENTLSNLTVTVSNFRQVSERALTTLDGVDQFVRTNTHPLSASVSNLVAFSEQLSQTAKEIRLTIATNRSEVHAIIKNIESASGEVDKLVSDLQTGRGLAGRLLKDAHLEQEFLATMNDLSLLSSNLGRFGLFWKPKARPSRPAPTAPPLGRNPRQ